MHIRPATPTDFPSTASLAASSFHNDELCIYTNPWRHQHPDHFRDSFLRRRHLAYWTPGSIFYVAVTDAGDDGHDDDGKGIVVGYAVWKRRGMSEEAREWQRQSWRGVLECILLQATEKYLTLLHADKSLDYTRLAHFINEGTEDFDAIPEVWKLQNLCVHIDYQRRGIGTLLMGWGKTQAEREGCPIGLQSSMSGRSMYLKNGFREYGKLDMEGFPFEDATYIWEPKGLEGKWG